MHIGEEMAIYHFTCKYVSRAGATDKNSVRSAAYCAGKELSDLNTGSTFNFSNKKEVVFSEIQAPANAPEWVADRQRLWSEVEKKEIRYDAKLMSQFEASLPNELDLEQAKALMYDFSSASLVKRGMVSDWSVHWVLHNKHVHVNTTTREISGEGFGKKVREWEEKKTLYALRKEWAECVNKHLSMAGFDVRIDHRSFKDQDIDHEPTVHVGPERSNNKEVVSERKERNRRTRNRNRIVDADKKADATIKQLEAEIQINKNNLVKAVARENKADLTKHKSIKNRIIHSLDDVQANIIKPTNKTFYPMASATLMPDLYSKMFPPEYIKPPIDTGILKSKRDLRLPNGKILIPDSFESFECTINAWELNPLELDTLRKKFWKLTKVDYYKGCIEQSLKKANHSPDIFDNFTLYELKKFKKQGMSPDALVDYCIKEHKRRSSLPYYFEKICELGKNTANLKPENFNPLVVCDGFENAVSHQAIVNFAVQKNKTYQIPLAIRHMLEGTSKAHEYQDVLNYCCNNELTMGQLWDFMKPWWEQITFDDYNSEIRKIALSYNRTMRLDMIPIDEIKQALEDRVSPEEFVRGISGPPGGGGGTGFNPTPGPLQPSNTQKPRTPWGNPITGTGYGI